MQNIRQPRLMSAAVVHCPMCHRGQYRHICDGCNRTGFISSEVWHAALTDMALTLLSASEQLDTVPGHINVSCAVSRATQETPTPEA
jgi:hypothetical protein